MSAELIITSVKVVDWGISKTIDTTMPSYYWGDITVPGIREATFTLQLGVNSSGDFSKYIGKRSGRFKRMKFTRDIMNGKLKITAVL